MANSFVVYPGQTGGTTDYSIPFEYLDQSFVKATVDGANTPLTFVSTYMVRIAPGPVGDLKIYRETAREPINEYTNGSILDASDLNVSFLQTVHMTEEVVDNTMVNDIDGSWDAKNLAIKNVADPQAPGDVATKRWAETTGSSFVTQAGLQADRSRTEANRSRDEGDRSKGEADRATTQANASASSAATALTRQNEATTQANRSKTEADRATTEANRARDLGAAEVVKAAAEVAKAALEVGKAKTEADRATTQADRSKTEADRSTTKATEAAGSATTAAGERQIAVTKAGEAAQSALEAKNFRDTASTHKDAAKGFRDEAEGFRNQAETLRNQTEELADQVNPEALLTKSGNLNGLTDPAYARGVLQLGNLATKNITVSTAEPSGGAEGDIWVQV